MSIEIPVGYATVPFEIIKKTKEIEFTAEQRADLLLYKKLYEEMFLLTTTACTGCKSKFSCCTPSSCKITQYELKELGISPPETNHKKGVFNSDNGCTLVPYLRQMCSDFLCDSVMRSNYDLYTKFRDLRDQTGLLYLKFEDQEIEPILGVYRILNESNTNM